MSSTLKLDSFRTRGGSFSLVGMDVINNKPKSTITRGRTSCVMTAFLSRLEFKNLLMNIALYWRHFNFMPVSSSDKTKFQNKSENYSHCCPIVCLPVCLSVCLSIHPPFRVPVHLSASVYLVICLSGYLAICLSICPSVYLSVCLSIPLSVCPSVCLFISLSICLSIRVSICLSIHRSIHSSVYLATCICIFQLCIRNIKHEVCFYLNNSVFPSQIWCS